MGEEVAQAAQTAGQGSFKRKAIVAGFILAAIGIVWVFGVYVLPAWYSRMIGNLADERLGFSGGLGLVIGFACTLIPLLLIRSAWRIRRGTKRAITLLSVALLVASPNLLLLGIVTGDSETAHNAERVLGTDAPWFRSWSVFGVCAGVVAYLGLGWLLMSRNRLKKKSQKLEAEAKS